MQIKSRKKKLKKTLTDLIKFRNAMHINGVDTEPFPNGDKLKATLLKSVDTWASLCPLSFCVVITFLEDFI